MRYSIELETSATGFQSRDKTRPSDPRNTRARERESLTMGPFDMEYVMSHDVADLYGRDVRGCRRAALTDEDYSIRVIRTRSRC